MFKSTHGIEVLKDLKRGVRNKLNYKFPRCAWSISMASKRALKLPAPNP